MSGANRAKKGLRVFDWVTRPFGPFAKGAYGIFGALVNVVADDGKAFRYASEQNEFQYVTGGSDKPSEREVGRIEALAALAPTLAFVVGGEMLLDGAGTGWLAFAVAVLWAGISLEMFRIWGAVTFEVYESKKAAKEFVNHNRDTSEGRR